jgi:hypothetical protein
MTDAGGYVIAVGNIPEPAVDKVYDERPFVIVHNPQQRLFKNLVCLTILSSRN